jgi:hypothetical protein
MGAKGRLFRTQSMSNAESSKTTIRTKESMVSAMGVGRRLVVRSNGVNQRERAGWNTSMTRDSSESNP